MRTVAASGCPRKIFARVESSTNTSCPVIFRVVHVAAYLCAAPSRRRRVPRRVWARAKTLRSRSSVHTRYYLCIHADISRVAGRPSPP